MAGILAAGGMIVFEKVKTKREEKKAAKEAEFERLQNYNLERIERLKREGSISSSEEESENHGYVEPPPYSPREGDSYSYDKRSFSMPLKDERKHRRASVLSFPIGRRSRKDELMSQR